MILCCFLLFSVASKREPFGGNHNTFIGPVEYRMATLSQARIAGWASRWATDELQALARVGNWEGAMSVFNQLEGMHITQTNVFHYTTVINACARAGEHDGAMRLFSKMKSKGVRPNIYTYTALINSCARDKKVDAALMLYAEARLSEIKPNVKTITALVTVCSRAGMWEKSMQMLQEAEELMIAPNVLTYTAVMDGCRRAAICAPAISLLAKMRNPDNVRPNEVTYNTLLGACKEAKDFDAALRVYARMAADGFPPRPYTKELLVELFRGTVLESSADDLVACSRPTRREIFAPDSDPVTAMRATMTTGEDA